MTKAGPARAAGGPPKGRRRRTGEPPGFGFPIFVLSFDRLGYLERVLASLMRQRGVGLQDCEIFLIQDGAIDEATGRAYCDPAIVARNERAFRAAFPKGHVLTSPFNLGTAANFARAEEIAFGVLEAEAAVFLEDDLVLGPDYLRVMSQLIGFALDDPRIGYVAAYGNHEVSAKWQADHLSRLQHLGHHWAFAMTRHQWLLQKPYVDEYLAIQCGANYRDRDNDAIVELFTGWGFGTPGTSQDIAKSHAARLTGCARINTAACFGTYIGAVGQHFDEQLFNEMGFGGAAALHGAEFRPKKPSDALVDAIVRYLALGGDQDLVAPQRMSREALRARLARQSENLVRRVKEGAAGGMLDLLGYGAARFPRTLDSLGHPLFAKEMTRALAALRRWPEAELWAARLEALTDRADPCASVLLARGYAAAGVADKAGERWRRVLAATPDSVEATEWLKENPGAAGATPIAIDTAAGSPAAI